MRILIFHGYLLHGTGSNIYNANLTQALARLGHEVHLLCQDRDAAELAWIAAVGRWAEGELRIEELREPGGAGSVTAYLPPIGAVLPVYVHDHYEGFEAKTFPTLDEAELKRYLEANVGAVAEVAERAGGVDAALANHLVMGPAILARAGLDFAVKVHGSALEYTVKPNPRRFLAYAEEGISAATAVLVGSRHTAESLWGALGDSALEQKTRLGPPGVDTEEFRPRDPGDSAQALEALAERLSAATEQQLGRTGPAAAAAIRDWAAAPGPRVVFVGKLIVSKGADLLLAAWPLVHARHPGARLLMAGFGAYGPGLRRLLAALEAGDLEGAREVARLGWALEGGEEKPLAILSAFLADPRPGYLEAAWAAAGSVDFPGRLEHDEVAAVLPSADALVMPSTFPEAFGMVAAEAAACGVLPVSAGHSGMREVSRRLAETLPPAARSLVSFEIAEGAVEALAERLLGWFALGAAEREAARAALVETARARWSWEGVASGVIAASQGRLEDLPAP